MRALTTSTGSAIVPTVWAADIIDRARNYAAVMQAGAQTVPMNAKIVQIGRLTADPAAGFRTEGSTITASDPTFDNVTLTAKTLNALVVGSTEFWQDASNAGDLVSEAMARALAVQIDLVALFGGVTAGAEQTGVGNNLLPSGGLPNPPNPSPMGRADTTNACGVTGNGSALRLAGHWPPAVVGPYPLP
jgi:HK97 family phage major capsid protein